MRLPQIQQKVKYNVKLIFIIRIALGMKNVCFVYIFKHMIKTAGSRDFAALGKIGDRRPPSPIIITVDVFRGKTVSLALDAQLSMSADVSSKLHYSSSGLLTLLQSPDHRHHTSTADNPAPKTRCCPGKTITVICQYTIEAYS
jgi:hypothetical protein